MRQVDERQFGRVADALTICGLGIIAQHIAKLHQPMHLIVLQRVGL